MGRRTGVIWELIWMYEGTQCLRLLEWQMIFVASANKITLQGFLSILVVSAEIKSEPEMTFWNGNPQISQLVIAHFSNLELDRIWKWGCINCWLCFGSQSEPSSCPGKGTRGAWLVTGLCLMTPMAPSHPTARTSNAPLRYFWISLVVLRTVLILLWAHLNLNLPSGDWPGALHWV